MQVSEFRFLLKSDPYDLRWLSWSRIYEYEWILEKLPPCGRVHNTACGDSAQASDFARELQLRGYDIVNSDIVQKHGIPNFTVYDLTSKWNGEPFDVVISISTLEHLSARDQELALNNLLDQVRPGGLVLLTFDWPVATLDAIEKRVGMPIRDSSCRLTTANGAISETRWGLLSIGVLAARVPGE